MIRLLFRFHRYLGIGVGLLMAMWCLSGLVMMYVSYPALDGRTRLAHLVPIDWRHCCRLSGAVLGDAARVQRFDIEMLGGRPVLELRGEPGSTELIDLSTGARIEEVSATQAASVAAPYVHAAGRAAVAGSAAVSGAPRLMGKVDFDQWTLAGVSPEERPLYRFQLRDGRGGELYVSSSTGRAVQLTTRRERFWNWLGAVPHWLYFADLRRRAWLWSQVVIYTSLLGCFLAATGLYVGVRQLVCRPAARWSPYRGLNLWHHLAGLLFGPFVLTWVLSGLLSMNPWGLMESAGGGPERARLRGAPITGAELRAALQALAAAAPAGVVSIESAPLAGRLFVIARDAGGFRHRLDAQGAPAPLSPADWRFIAAVLHGDPAAIPLLTRGDGYYFSLPAEPAALPVRRVAARDGSGRRYYLDPVSGALIRDVDRAAVHYRWWHDALHRMDFTAAIRQGPGRQVLMWLLMGGATVVCVTGTYLAYRRLGRW